MSLRNRLALAGGAVVLAALVLASLVLYPSLGAKLNEQHDTELVSAAAQAPEMVRAFKEKGAAAAVAEGGPDRPAIPSKPVDVGPALLQFVVPPVNAGATEGFTDVSARDVAVAQGERPAYFHDASYGGRHYRIYTAEMVDSPGVLVRTAILTSVVQGTLNRLAFLLVAIAAGGCLLAAVAGRLAAGRVLRPVRQLTETVEHVTATQDLTARLSADGRDEIARLTRSFAAMMAALEESVGAQRRLVADASHELRTPLTSLTTNLELLGEGPALADPQAPALVAEARAQAAELTSLVNDLVDLGRYGGVRAHTEDTRLDLLARRVLDRAAARSPRLDFTAELAPCLVHADPDAVERAIGNLVDNAVKWSPEGGRITVVTTAAGVLSVSDRGPGIPASDLPFVFDRFYRSPAARSLPGSGLGLAIVRQIAETHGGTVTAEPLPRGVRLRLALPPIA
ncbi:sensor histidine kinase [Actinacidiphila paucisporea]|uniref:histidine kinase n=1 Tax=Actinacidiphila paucisporea TaxID=310782 RepID=A0A1M7QPE2_9ACTN|nr:HAMP domain-containing sensor histidine kinase [Actinacidiphila paucisporea]SHN33373.1 two-component system, OmpR family, sensor histidine kinase MprB [Actinacidiphila paucisporea]